MRQGGPSRDRADAPKVAWAGGCVRAATAAAAATATRHHTVGCDHGSRGSRAAPPAAAADAPAAASKTRAAPTQPRQVDGEGEQPLHMLTPIARDRRGHEHGHGLPRARARVAGA